MLDLKYSLHVHHHHHQPPRFSVIPHNVDIGDSLAFHADVGGSNTNQDQYFEESWLRNTKLFLSCACKQKYNYS